MTRDVAVRKTTLVELVHHVVLTNPLWKFGQVQPVQFD
jgi:hypothetical protein